MNDISTHLALKVENREVFKIEEAVCMEEIFPPYLNDKFIAKLTASPNHVKELGAGYVICEGLAENVSDVKISCNKIYVYANEINEFQPELRSSGCLEHKS